jgi:hypothetical protein
MTDNVHSDVNANVTGTSRAGGDMGAVGSDPRTSSSPRDEPMGENVLEVGEGPSLVPQDASAPSLKERLTKVLEDQEVVEALTRALKLADSKSTRESRLIARGWPPLKSEKDIDAWTRTFEAKMAPYRRSDSEMGIEAIGLIADPIFLAARNALGEDYNGTWSQLKRGLLLIADGANPVLAHGRKLMNLFAVKQKGGLEEVHDRVRATAQAFVAACKATPAGQVLPDHLAIPFMFKWLDPNVARGISLEAALKSKEPLTYIYT